MSGPWEEYVDMEAEKKDAAPQGPWAAYKEDPEEKGSIASRIDRPILNEQHPSISNKDRFLAKNLSVGSDTSYLEKTYPDLTFSYRNGEAVVKAPGEKEWRKIEPGNMGFDYSGEGGIGEFGKDATDVMYDLPAAGLETLGTIIGGTAGAASPVPGGAIMGGMALGGATAAGTEGIRQSLSQMAGVSDDYSGKDVGVSAAFGAAAPLLMGTGASGKHITKKLVKDYMKKGMSADAAEVAAKEAAESMIKAQKGAIVRVLGPSTKFLTTGLMTTLSGYQPAALAKLRKMIASGKMSIPDTEISRGLRADMVNGIQAEKKILGKAYSESLDALDVQVDTDAAQAPLLDLLSKYRDKAEEISPGFEDLLKSKKVNKDLKKKIKNLHEVDDYLFLKETLDGKLDKDMTREGAGIVEYLDKMNDLTNIRKRPDINAKASKVDQDLERVARQVADDVNNSLGDTVLGEEFRLVKERFAQVYKDEKTLKTYMPTDRATEKVLKNLDGGESVRREDLLDLAGRYNVPIREYGDTLFVLKNFQRPAADMISMRGTTSTSKTIPAAAMGGMSGYALGQKIPYLSPFVSALAGTAAGSKAGSPKAIRKYIELGDKIRRASDRAAPVPQGTLNLWQQMNQSEGK